MLPRWVRRTNDDKVAGTVRRFLGMLFVLAGLTKIFIPMLAHSWAGQLEAANIPFDALNLWLVPVLEMFIGILLILGSSTRIAAALVVPIMLVAIYVHIVVDDPAMFPFQPRLPIVPVVLLVLSLFLLWRGGGAWSIDLKLSHGRDV
jgi:uncharacterized membrane protein YphA (DoxX/SURF4 family)